MNQLIVIKPNARSSWAEVMASVSWAVSKPFPGPSLVTSAGGISTGTYSALPAPP
jgi:hypothetical protein